MVQSQEMEKKTFPVWNTIQLGTYKTGVELLAAIEEMQDEKGRREFGDIEKKEYPLVRELIPRILMASSPVPVELVAASMADLGLPDTTRQDVIEAAARRYGLRRCSPETAFQVRLQTRQEQYESYYVLVSPIVGVEADVRFDVYGLSYKQHLRAQIVSPENIYGMSEQCVFLWQRAET